MTRTYELVYLSLISVRYVGPNWCLLCKWSSRFWKSWLAYFVIRKLPSLLLTYLLLEGWSLLMVEGSSDVSISSVHMFRVSNQGSYIHHILEPELATGGPTSSVQSETRMIIPQFSSWYEEAFFCRDQCCNEVSSTAGCVSACWLSGDEAGCILSCQ